MQRGRRQKLDADADNDREVEAEFSIVRLMRWDRPSWMAVGGIAMLVLSGAMLLADTSEGFARGRHGALGRMRRHVHRERDLAELLSAVQFRERNSQLLTISDAACKAGLRRIERDPVRQFRPVRFSSRYFKSKRPRFAAELRAVGRRLPLQLRDAGSGAVFVLLAGATADPAGALDDAIAYDRNRSRRHDHVAALAEPFRIKGRRVGQHVCAVNFSHHVADAA